MIDSEHPQSPSLRIPVTIEACAEIHSRSIIQPNSRIGGIAMEMTTTTSKPNIRKLTEFINAQRNPELFATALFAFAKPRTQDLTDTQKELQVVVR